MKVKKNIILQAILWIVQGALVGIGAILPGVSGGTLCYAFGIYNPLLEVLANPIKGLKKHWLMLIFVVLGVGVGFVGFSGITAWLLAWNTPIVLSVFMGLIFGTVPDIWRDAGEQGRNKFSIIALVTSFVALMAAFVSIQSFVSLTVPPSFFAWMLCGLLWGLGFIVPGLSSSTFIVFFGLYGQMSEGISKFDFSVLVPLGIALLATFLLLSKVMKLVIDKFHSVVSHCVLGFVLATTLMISTASENGSPTILGTFSGANIPIYLSCIVAGAAVSYLLTLLFAKIRAIVESAEEDTKEI